MICSLIPIRLRASQGQEENLLLLSLIRTRGSLGILSVSIRDVYYQVVSHVPGLGRHDSINVWAG